jgi:tetratricopeptide (TPR) repeat protein
MEAPQMLVSLNFFEELLSRASHQLAIGRTFAGIHSLRHLLSFPDLPTALAEQCHLRIGEVAIRRRRWQEAIRSLRQAVRLNPEASRYRFLLGLALRQDGQYEKAAKAFARSLKLQPNQPRCLTEYGLLCVEVGRTNKGIKLLRKAADLVPSDVPTLRKLTHGLLLAGRTDEAIAAVQIHRFHAPRCPRLGRVWAELQLKLLRRKQEIERSQAEAGPVILPFLRVEKQTSHTFTEIPNGSTDSLSPALVLRCDDAEPMTGPHLMRMRARRYNRRPHA